jgi:hypothetical protein
MPSSSTDFDGPRRLVALGTFELQTKAVGSERDDRKSTAKWRMHVFLKTLTVCKDTYGMHPKPLQLHVAASEGFQ